MDAQDAWDRSVQVVKFFFQVLNPHTLELQHVYGGGVILHRFGAGVRRLVLRQVLQELGVLRKSMPVLLRLARSAHAP